MSKDAFYLKVASALSGCQLVEQELKLYITEAFDLVRKCVGDQMVFSMKGEDLAGANLWELTKTFRCLTSNEALVAKLDKFRKERNFLAHQGISSCLDYEGDLSDSTVAEYEKRLDRMQLEAETLRMDIHLEANKWRGSLYFDPIP